MSIILNKVKAFTSTRENRIEKLLFSKDSYLVESVLMTHSDLNINYINEEGKTALFGADYIKAEALIKAGIDINAKDKDGNTALFFSDYMTTNLLLSKGANVNHRNNAGMTALFRADRSKAKLLINAGARVNVKSYVESTTALQMAYIRHDMSVMKVLIESGADIHHNWRGYSAQAKAFMTSIINEQAA
ncbi:TPA: ankyrin repeat domain-containing protein [Klebsiella pneumoniae subsp. pneumoniae]|nr:ankyrin repeat domain-containing protein [Klebsiella pneumoniae subsp. pneumoniae]HDU3724721.1 ankyrin repeat domain-containing protein [Klebsiella pneumoniae subsp. pneumoniae]HDU3740286.1 ankyrin repeat domain-containing protein [Klebsiella pneumoniae subsp. pneumoniae]HDU5905182.1 ankyrin repeat domain-containing protein [Klebsiella pneumoniae subsp. pneumoniae]